MAFVKIMISTLLIISLGVMSFIRSSLYESDVTLWRDAVAKSPGKYRPNNEAGDSLGKTDRLDEAIRYLERAIAINPNEPAALNNLANIYNRQDRRGEALALIHRALFLDPGHVPARYNLAIYYYEKGMTAEASREYATIIQLEPESKEADFARQMLFLMQQRLQ